MTHAEVACRLVGELPPGVFARAVQAGVMHHDFEMLKQMLPGVSFTSQKINPGVWELLGTCADGSVAVWLAG